MTAGRDAPWAADRPSRQAPRLGRWRPILWLAAGAVAYAALRSVFKPGPLVAEAGVLPGVKTPLGIGPSEVWDVIEAVAGALAAATPARVTSVR